MVKHTVEENVEPGLKYSEETGRTVRSLPRRDCCLWQTSVDEPVSSLEVLSFRQRFGAAVIPTEGIGGVETLPQFRFIQSHPLMLHYLRLLAGTIHRHCVYDSMPGPGGPTSRRSLNPC